MPRSDPPADFERLLDAILAEPDRREELSAQLHTTYSQRKAVLVLDMCGFARTTQQRGIVAFLLMIRRMRRICEPCFAEHGGELIKAEADNLFYTFDSASAAVAAAVEAQRRIAEGNNGASPEEHIFCAIGIGFGEILCLGGTHIHGHEVNLASKLGEDIATDGQILLTPGAHAALEDAVLPTREGMVLISGLELSYHEVLP